VQQIALYSITLSAAISKSLRYREAERLGSPEIDHQFELGRQLYGNDCLGAGDQPIVTQSQQFAEKRCESHLQPSRNCERLQSPVK